MRLRAGLAVLRRGSTCVQVGVDPRWAVRIEELAPAEADAFVALAAGGDLRRLADQVPGAGRTRLAEVAAMLADAGLATERDTRRLAGPVATEQGLAALLGGPDPAARRAAACVGIVGLGPIGLVLASTLAASGVGALLLDDARAVRSVDIGHGGYRWDDVGSSRDSVAARVVRDVAPAVSVGSGSPDLVVLVQGGAVDPDQAPALLAAGITHVPVVTREGDVVVGPLVVPGDGPCLRCLDLHRCDLDPDWPEVALQLSARAGDAPGAGEVPAVAAVCAGLVAAAVLAHLDGGASPLRGASYEVGVPHAVPLRRTWAVHPSCGCTALPSAAEPAASPG